MNKLAIATKNLTRNFTNIQALDNLCLHIPYGTIFGFLGANGSGKTTTIHLLLGLLKPTVGSATVLGFDSQTQAAEIRKRTGVLLEHNGLYERLSAEDNLEFYGRAYHLPPKERRERIRELLTYFGLWQRRQEKVSKWSRGMKQKLAVARALLHKPSLVFLDEPTAGLDPVAAFIMGDLLLELVKQEKITVFLNTHHLAEAEKLCDRVGIIKEGKLLIEGNLQDLKANWSSQQIDILGYDFDRQAQQLLSSCPTVNHVQRKHNLLQVDLAAKADVSPLVSLLSQQGYIVNGVHHHPVSLEEIFFSLIKREK